MDVTQVYLFSGSDFVRRANGFLNHAIVKRNLIKPKVRCEETFISIIAEIGWMAVDEIWHVYVEIVESEA